MKNSTTEIISSVDGFKARLDTTEERFNKLKDMPEEMFLEHCREK